MLRVVDSKLAPKLVERYLLRRMFTDSAVPGCAVAGTLVPRICLDLDCVLLVHLAFVPVFRSPEQFAARRDNLLVRGQLYVLLLRFSLPVTDAAKRDGPSRRSSCAMVSLKADDIVGGGEWVRNVKCNP
jgi:hypothetical protein